MFISWSLIFPYQYFDPSVHKGTTAPLSRNLDLYVSGMPLEGLGGMLGRLLGRCWGHVWDFFWGLSKAFEQLWGRCLEINTCIKILWTNLQKPIKPLSLYIYIYMLLLFLKKHVFFVESCIFVLFLLLVFAIPPETSPEETVTVLNRHPVRPFYEGKS